MNDSKVEFPADSESARFAEMARNYYRDQPGSTATRLKKEGFIQGVWIGKLQMLQEHMGQPVTERCELDGLDATALEQRFSILWSEYNAQRRPAAAP